METTKKNRLQTKTTTSKNSLDKKKLQLKINIDTQIENPFDFMENQNDSTVTHKTESDKFV